MSDEDISDEVKEIFREASVVYTPVPEIIIQRADSDRLTDEVNLDRLKDEEDIEDTFSRIEVPYEGRIDFTADPNGEYVAVVKPKHEEDRYR